MQRYRETLCLLAWLLGAETAHAASLQKVEQGTWSTGGVPGYVNMYLYVPDKLAPKPPVLVASHHCGGSAMSTYNETRSTFVSLADKNGFVIIFPEATGHNCWDVGSAKSLKHDGGGDTHAIAQMVRYVLTKHAADASRVYAFGTSSGAMMTQALLGVYPDMFMAGVAAAGVPCGCWAEGYTGDSGANQQWSGPCAGGNVSKTARQWGDQVRAMFPGYTGHRPRVQLWHGTADTTISFKNFGESVKQWTDVLGLDAQAGTSDSARAGFMHQSWKSACGFVVLDTWAQQGAGHGVSWDAASAASFLGLEAVGMQDPEAAACPQGSAPGAASAAGSGGAGAGNAGSSAAGSGAVSSSAAGGAAAGSSAGSSATPDAAAASRAAAGNASAASGAVAGAAAASGARPRGAVAGGSASPAGAGVVAQTSAGQRAAESVVAAGSAGVPAAIADSESGGCSAARGRGVGLGWLLGAVLAVLVRRRGARA